MPPHFQVFIEDLGHIHRANWRNPQRIIHENCINDFMTKNENMTATLCSWISFENCSHMEGQASWQCPAWYCWPWAEQGKPIKSILALIISNQILSRRQSNISQYTHCLHPWSAVPVFIWTPSGITTTHDCDNNQTTFLNWRSRCTNTTHLTNNVFFSSLEQFWRPALQWLFFE